MSIRGKILKENKIGKRKDEGFGKERPLDKKRVKVKRTLAEYNLWSSITTSLRYEVVFEPKTYTASLSYILDFVTTAIRPKNIINDRKLCRYILEQKHLLGQTKSIEAFWYKAIDIKPWYIIVGRFILSNMDNKIRILKFHSLPLLGEKKLIKQHIVASIDYRFLTTDGLRMAKNLQELTGATLPEIAFLANKKRDWSFNCEAISRYILW